METLCDLGGWRQRRGEEEPSSQVRSSRTVRLLFVLFALFSATPCFAENEATDRQVALPMTAADEVLASWRLDLDRLNRTLAQIEISPEKQPPEPVPPRNGEKVELTLEKSIEIALKKNLDIRIAVLSKNALEPEIARARAIFHPLVGVGLTAAGERSIPDKGDTLETNVQAATPFIRALLPTGATASVSLIGDLSRTETTGKKPPTTFDSGLALSVVQPLFRGGRIFVATKPIRDAESDVRIEEAKLRAQILRVIAATKSAYYNLVFTERVIEVTEAAIQRDKALVESSQALFKAGLVTKRDVFSAEISHAKDAARLVSAQADQESAQNALVDVLGLAIGAEVLPLNKDIQFQPVSPELKTWIAAAGRNRPEILELNERLSKSWLNVRTARNALLPQVDLVASYGKSQTGSTFFGQNLGLKDLWTAGIVFSIPLGNVAATSALARAELEHERFKQELVQRQRLVELEVRAAVIKLHKNLERMTALRVVLDQAKGKLDVAKARFALGLATNLDITDAQADILNAETDLLKATVDYNIGLAELEASIAGPIDLGG